MNENEFLICTRCGERIRKEQRNCLKCGQLNFKNPDNEYMKKYEKKYKHIINRNSIVKNLSIYNNERPNEVLANNIGNIYVFSIVNIIIFTILFLMLIFNFFKGNLFFNREFIVLLLILEIVYLEFYSAELLFMKANKPWWYSFIVFGIILLFLILISVFKINFLIYILILLIFVIDYNIGYAFGKNPWFCVFFLLLMLPSMAFSNTISYYGISYVIGGNKANTFELFNKYTRFILFFNISLIVLIFILFFLSFIL